MRVGLVGRSDHDNFGDSLMFAFYVHSLNKMGFKAVIIEASEVFIDRLRDDGLDCESVSLKDVGCLEAVFFVGGGYFGEPDLGAGEWNDRFVREGYFSSIASTLKRESIPYHIYGVEIGPLRAKASRAMVSEILEGAGSIIVRNQGSYEFVTKTLGFDCSMKRDVVLGETARYFQGFDSNRKEGRDLIIHATGKILKNNFLSKIIKNKIITFARSGGFSRVKVLFDQTSFPELIPSANELALTIKRSGIDACVVEYTGIANLLSNVHGASHVITTKLHVGVVALSLSKNVCCISSMPKNKRFYSEVFKGKGIKSLFSMFIPLIKITEGSFVKVTEENSDEVCSSLSYLDDFEKLGSR